MAHVRILFVFLSFFFFFLVNPRSSSLQEVNDVNLPLIGLAHTCMLTVTATEYKPTADASCFFFEQAR